jgi:diguanylate cyclase (GGDEF)-like protein
MGTLRHTRDAEGSKLLRAGQNFFIVGAIIVGLIAALAGLAIWNARISAFQDGLRDATNLAVALGEQTARYVDTIDLPMMEAGSWTAQSDRRTPATSKSRMQSAEIEQLLGERRSTVPDGHAVILVSADGEIVNSSRVKFVPGMSVSDSDYYQYLKAHDDPAMVVGSPATSRTTGKPSLFFARRVSGPDGIFLGLVVGVVDAAYLSNFYRSISERLAGAVTLLRRDGTVLVRYPDPAHVSGFRIPRGVLWYSLVTDGGGYYRSQGLLESKPTLVVVHPLQDYPLVVNVTIPESVILAPWRRQVIHIAAAALIVGICCLFMTYIISRQFGRQRWQNVKLSQAGAQMLASEQKLRTFAEMSADWFWEQDADFRFKVQTVIPSMNADDDTGKTRWELADPAMTEDRWASHKATLADQQPFRNFCWERLDNQGKRHFMTVSGDPVFDLAGTFTGYRGTGREITADVEAAEELRLAKEQAQAAVLTMTYAAEHDFLTGLPNRVLLNDRIGQAIALAQRCQRKLAVLFLDLDGFKHINDSLGHSIGDKLLQSIAKRLVACVRSSDTVSRQGGDEFVVLFPEMDQSEGAASAASRIAEALAGPHLIEQDLHDDVAYTATRMLEAVAETHSVTRHDLHVTACIGVSVYPDDGMDAETLVQNADAAMYQAKENGRQSYQFFKPEMNALAVERQFIEANLRQALGRNEFALHYQPIVDLRTGDLIGAEALIRWTHPSRGLISPGQFIPIAEDCGVIVSIGDWVLREACKQARAWLDEGLPATTMAINVSTMSFRRANFVANLFTTLSETGFDPNSLVLELTESMLIKHVDSAVLILRTLRESGIQVAVDDFGTGYSSLGYLRKFPLDVLKIDQSFVRQISSDGEGTAIVAAVIGMAQGLKLRVIAEGVETLEQLMFLRAHHCEEAQGHYFSEPVTAQQFAILLGSGIHN